MHLAFDIRHKSLLLVFPEWKKPQLFARNEKCSNHHCENKSLISWRIYSSDVRYSFDVIARLESVDVLSHSNKKPWNKSFVFREINDWRRPWSSGEYVSIVDCLASTPSLDRRRRLSFACSTILLLPPRECFKAISLHSLLLFVDYLLIKRGNLCTDAAVCLCAAAFCLSLPPAVLLLSVCNTWASQQCNSSEHIDWEISRADNDNFLGQL